MVDNWLSSPLQLPWLSCVGWWWSSPGWRMAASPPSPRNWSLSFPPPPGCCTRYDIFLPRYVNNTPNCKNETDQTCYCTGRKVENLGYIPPHLMAPTYVKCLFTSGAIFLINEQVKMNIYAQFDAFICDVNGSTIIPLTITENKNKCGFWLLYYLL